MKSRRRNFFNRMKSRGYLSLLAWGPPQGTISLDHMVWVICNFHNWDFQSPFFSIPRTDLFTSMLCSYTSKKVKFSYCSICNMSYKKCLIKKSWYKHYMNCIFNLFNHHVINLILFCKYVSFYSFFIKYILSSCCYFDLIL